MLAADSNHSKEEGTITFDRSIRILLCEAKIQHAAPITPGRTADTSGKPVNQPGQLLKSPGPQNVQLGFCSAPRWHAFILSKLQRFELCPAKWGAHTPARALSCKIGPFPSSIFHAISIAPQSRGRSSCISTHRPPRAIALACLRYFTNLTFIFNAVNIAHTSSRKHRAGPVHVARTT